MNATEIAIYAVETKAIIHILWGLLLIASASLVGVSISYVLLRIKLRSAKKRESQLARQIAARSAEIVHLEAKVAGLAELEGNADAMKAKLRRALDTRAKSEQRLVDQNGEIDSLRDKVAEQEGELMHLRSLMEITGPSHARDDQRAA